MAMNQDLQSLYRHRFTANGEFRKAMWRTLYRDFFARYIPMDSVVMELGAGYCEFINVVHAKHKIALDVNPDTKVHAGEDVEVLIGSSTDLSSVGAGTIGVVFASNLLEHLERDAIVATLREIRRVLSPDGRLLILQPNIRFCAKDYWMFFDHITAIDDRGLAEALMVHGFDIDEVIVRFLPYTAQSRLPKSVNLVRWYLRLPLLWRVLGKQSFIVARPSPNS